MNQNPDQAGRGSWQLPPVSRLVWATIIGAFLAFYFLGGPAANTVAIVGAVIVTIAIVRRERSS